MYAAAASKDVITVPFSTDINNNKQEIKRVSRGIDGNLKVVRVQPSNAAKEQQRLVGLRIMPADIEEVVATIKQGTPSDSSIYEGREHRIVCSPEEKILRTIVMHDCLNPSGIDEVTFDLPQGWERDSTCPDLCVSCVARIFKIPLQNALLSQLEPLRPAQWTKNSQLRVILDEKGTEATVALSTEPDKTLQSVKLDVHLREGKNTVRYMTNEVFYDCADSYTYKVSVVAEQC